MVTNQVFLFLISLRRGPVRKPHHFSSDYWRLRSWARERERVWAATVSPLGTPESRISFDLHSVFPLHSPISPFKSVHCISPFSLHIRSMCLICLSQSREHSLPFSYRWSLLFLNSHTTHKKSGCIRKRKSLHILSALWLWWIDTFSLILYIWQ